MDAVKDSSVVVADTSDHFTKVTSKKSRKRKHDEQEMDTEDSVARKRPQFPALSGDKLKVHL